MLRDERVTNVEINQTQMRTALLVVGANDIPPERMGSKIIEISRQSDVLKASISAVQSDDQSRIAALKAEVKVAVEAGDQTKADALLAEVSGLQKSTAAAEKSRLEGHLAVGAVSETETVVQRGEIALAKLRYMEAAKYFASAAALVPSTRAAAMVAQNDLGDTLVLLGERENGTAKFMEASEAYREALKERVPLDWAETQEQSLRCAQFVGRGRDGHDQARRGDGRLSRSLAGANAGARSSRVGQPSKQPCACIAASRAARG